VIDSWQPFVRIAEHIHFNNREPSTCGSDWELRNCMLQVGRIRGALAYQFTRSRKVYIRVLSTIVTDSFGGRRFGTGKRKFVTILEEYVDEHKRGLQE